jgi:sigma-B regulation protein RsbU (phosphoserine phosphatase)
MATAASNEPRHTDPASPWWSNGRELQIARRVQARLLPDARPRLAHFACDGLTVPAGGVGGDFYDFLTPKPGTLVLVIGDLSGHGVPAALMMSSLHALLRSQYAFATDDLCARLESVNRLFSDFTDDGHYATLFVGEYDEVSGRLHYANCGHPAPLLLRANGLLDRLESTTTVIGALHDWSCATADVTLGPGDDLLLHSDGVTEATDRDGAFYGEERLEQALRASRSRELSALAWAIVGDVRRFTGGPLDDDLTIVVARPRDGRG